MDTITDPAAGIVAEAAPLVKKTCRKCEVEKVLEEFHLSKNHKFGRKGRCKVCECAYARDYAQRPDVKERQRAYSQRSEYKEKLRAYYQRPEVKARRRAYEQRSEYKEQQRAHARDRRRTDPAFKLKLALRTRLSLALKRTRKSARTLELLGCTIEALRAHLEAQFKPGMTWDNYGEWHVDHIRPCASFDLSDPAQQRTCFNYTNLQPLWAEENIRKGAKFSLPTQALDATVPPCSPPSLPPYASNGNTDLGANCSTERAACS